MPVTTALELQDVVSLDHGDDVVIALEPVVATGMHPADIVTTVGRTTFVSHNSDQLVEAIV